MCSENLATNWTIDFLPSARRDLHSLKIDLSERVYRDILEQIGDLREDPTPAEAVHLRRTKNLYRIRVEENHRVIYRVSFGQRRILVVTIRPRGEAYIGWVKWGADRTTPWDI